jgi:hypothetical protein
MTLEQFERLNAKDQEYILQNEAVHIGTVQYGKETFILFQVDGFYLEIQSNFSGKKFTTASFFEETDLLDSYLNQVDISEIYECLGYY